MVERDYGGIKVNFTKGEAERLQEIRENRQEKFRQDRDGGKTLSQDKRVELLRLIYGPDINANAISKRGRG